jgi:hypothetical protein
MMVAIAAFGVVGYVFIEYITVSDSKLLNLRRCVLAC